jgi:hypothetical protein
MLHFISSVDRYSVLADEKWAHLFDCGGYNTLLPSQSNRYRECKWSRFIIWHANLKLHSSYNFDEKYLQYTQTGRDALLYTRNMYGYIVEMYDLIVRRLNYIPRHQSKADNFAQTFLEILLWLAWSTSSGRLWNYLNWTKLCYTQAVECLNPLHLDST